MKKYLYLLLCLFFISCHVYKNDGEIRHYRITGIRLASKGYFVWLQRLEYQHYRFFKNLPDSIKVGSIVQLKALGKKK